MISVSNIPFLFLVLVIIILFVWVIKLNQKIGKLLLGGVAKDLPESLEILKKSADSNEIFKKEISAYLKVAESRILRSTKAVSLVRFNPFKGSGEGGQSFAATFLNEEGDGLILSTLYARDRVSVYAKPLLKFNSTFELTGEERESLQKAKNDLKPKA